MEHKKYEEQFSIRSYELDFNNRLFTSSMFDYLQQVATNHAVELGFGFFDLEDRGLYWVLARNHLDIYRYPTYGERLRVVTWPKGTDKLMALRDYIIYGAQGDIVAKATSTWVLMDLNKHRPVRPPKDLFIQVDEHAIESVPPKLMEPDGDGDIFYHEVGYSECDMNGHVNNVNYVRWIQNTFKQDQYNEYSIKDMQINFLCECGMDHAIDIVKKQVSSTVWYVEGYNKTLDRKAFQAMVTWEVNSAFIQLNNEPRTTA